MFTATEHSFHIKFQYDDQCHNRKYVYCNFVVDGVSQLVAILDSSKVHEGNSEDPLTSLRNIQNNKLMNHSSKQMHYINNQQILWPHLIQFILVFDQSIM